MQTHIITTYSFEELNGDAKQKAIDNNREINIYGDWHESVIDGWKEKLKAAGIEVTNIYFSGFASQGDAAMFEGSVHWTDVAKFLQAYPCTVDRRVLALINNRDIEVSWKVKHRGHYYHSNCSDLEFYSNYEYNECLNYKNIEWELQALEEHFSDIYHDICNTIYRELEQEYEYQTSDDAIKETLIANEYEFYEDGRRY